MGGADAEPSRSISPDPDATRAAVAIIGRLLADVRRFPSGCSGLLAVDRIEARGVEGRTELQLSHCSAPQRRWLLKHGAGVRFVGL